MKKWWMVKWCNGKEGRVGEQKIWESGKHRSSAFRPVLASWTLLMPPSAAAATTTAVGRYRHCRRPPPFLSPPLAATVAASGRWRRLSLPLLPPLVAATATASGLCHNKWIDSIFVRNKTTNPYLYFTITPFYHPLFHHCTIGQFKMKHNRIREFS